MSAQNEIIAKYGEPGSEYRAKYCEMWEVQEDFPWFPARRIFINKDFRLRLMLAFTAMQAENLQHEIVTFDGCYVERQVRGSSLISLHSWAMAMDLNAHTEQLGQLQTHFSQEFIACMTGAGLFWGGNFHARKDPMHFALFNG